MKMFGKEPGTTIPRRCPSRITLATILTNVRIERFTVFTSNWYSTAVARSWLYRGGISVFTIWVLSRFYLSSFAILSQFHRGFFWRNFKNSKWAIFCRGQSQVSSQKNKKRFKNSTTAIFTGNKVRFQRNLWFVTKTSLFHAENVCFSL